MKLKKIKGTKEYLLLPTCRELQWANLHAISFNLSIKHYDINNITLIFTDEKSEAQNS